MSDDPCYMFGDLDLGDDSSPLPSPEPSPLAREPPASEIRGETAGDARATPVGVSPIISEEVTVGDASYMIEYTAGNVPVTDTPPSGWQRYGRGIYLQTLLQLRLWTDEQLVAAVHAYYPHSRTGVNDVKFNASLIARRVGVKPSTLRRNVEEQELLPPPPWHPFFVRCAGDVLQELSLNHLRDYFRDRETAAQAPGVATPSETGSVTPNATREAVDLPPVTPASEIAHGIGVMKSSPSPPVSYEKQPSRFRESVDPDREFDKTSLREKSHGQWIHRDYFAHAMRWSHAGRYISGKTDVLDVGCGPDVQLINVLTMPRNQVPKSYVGVDLNREPQKHPNRGWATLHWNFNFLERWQELGQFDVVTCFEMVEHLHAPDGIRLLTGIRGCLREDGLALLSTPVFSGKAAATHLHEYTIEELGDAIATAGLSVERRFGTFANATAIRKVASQEDLRLLERLHPYYSDEILACIIAPLYPDVARNNIWLLRR